MAAHIICSPYKHNRFSPRFQDIIDSTVLACQMGYPDCMFRRKAGRVKPFNEYVALNVLSNKEIVESGNDIVNRLEGLDGLNEYNVNSPDDYLNEAAAFEWISIPPKTQMTVRKKVDLKMKGDTGRLKVKINSVNRLSFEFKRLKSQDDQ